MTYIQRVPRGRRGPLFPKSPGAWFALACTCIDRCAAHSAPCPPLTINSSRISPPSLIHHHRHTRHAQPATRPPLLLADVAASRAASASVCSKCGAAKSQSNIPRVRSAQHASTGAAASQHRPQRSLQGAACSQRRAERRRIGGMRLGLEGAHDERTLVQAWDKGQPAQLSLLDGQRPALAQHRAPARGREV